MDNSNIKTFFTDEIINSYVNYELNGGYPIRESLGGYELLNYKQFMDWWNDYPSSNLSKFMNDSINDSYRRIFTSKCEDLNSGYIYRAIDSLRNNPNFDVLFAVYKKSDILLDNTENPKQTEIHTYQSRKSNSVGGFIIVQKGECKKQPQQPQRSIFNSFNFLNNNNIKNENETNYNNVYSVFLICSANNSYMDDELPPPIKGQLLMGAYLFTIKSNMLLPQIAILELLDGYRNIPGFIAYSKLGFEKDLKLYEKNCFYSLKTLPMSNNLRNKNTTDIIQFVAKDVDIMISPESRKIITFYESNKNNKENQERLGLLYNILYRIELQPIQILTDLIHVYDGDIDPDSGYTRNYEEMQDFFGYEETDDLTSVFYDKKNAFLDDGDYDQDSNITISNYPKIIEKIKQYYKNEINNMMLLSKTNNNNHKLHYIDCDDDDDDVSQPKKRCKTRLGGKKQKTNKKHIQHKKKTSRNSKRKPNNKNKKPVETRKNRKIKTTKNK
jgi:hypothetical protein